MPDSTPPSGQQVSTSGAIAEESVLAASTGDLPTDEDRLGFEPYVRALAEFLTNPSTHGPLTVSIEGEWGSGKSSFILQLQQRLIDIADNLSTQQEHRIPLTVRFNAWRHDKDEAMWAAFATEFTRRIALQQSLIRRWWGHLLLLERRFRWRDGWLDVVRSVLQWSAIVAIATTIFVFAYTQGWAALASALNQLPKPENVTDRTWSTLQVWLGAFGRTGVALGYFAVLLVGLKRLKEYIGNPLEVDFNRYLSRPDYTSRVSFIEQFHEDFSKIVDAYAGDKTVYVFIDDLDRCEVPRAAELMQALNLMMSSDRRGLIFIIGMDRQKVAAGLALKNEKLLRYLASDRSGARLSDGALDAVVGLEFGYNFIEKFIQIPFLVPSPAPRNIARFFDTISSGETVRRRPGNLAIVRDRIADFWNGQQDRLLQDARRLRTPVEDRGTTPTTPQLPSAERTIERRERVKLAATGDSPSVREIVLIVAPALGNNPRRLKQFVNLLRLRVFIAAETGLFDDDDQLTLQQLGKFVAISLRWPMLLGDLERDPALLHSLTSVAIKSSTGSDSKSAGALAYWGADVQLMRLLRAAPESEGDHFENWSLANVNIAKLLKVSPRVRTLAPSISATAVAAVPNASSVAATAINQDAFSATKSTVEEEVLTSEKTEAAAVLVYEPGDFTEVASLQQHLVSEGIDTQSIEGRLAGSNLVVKLAPDNSDRILFCVGVSALMRLDRLEDTATAIGDDRIPVIMMSVEGGFLNEQFRGRLYFDIREPQGFEKLVTYLKLGFAPKTAMA